jgi:hypothetical protein
MMTVTIKGHNLTVSYKDLPVMRFQLKVVYSGKKSNPYRKLTYTIALDLPEDDTEYSAVNQCIEALKLVLDKPLEHIGHFVATFNVVDTWEELDDTQYSKATYTWVILNTL